MGKLVLVVDDEDLTRQMIAMFLKMDGYTSIEAEDGIEALEQVAKHHPDGIILDVMMPKMDGIEVCRIIKSDPSKNIVGIEINANHLKYADSGYVYGLTTPVKIGKTLHVWNTQIFNELGDLICVSRLTTMVMQKK